MTAVHADTFSAVRETVIETLGLDVDPDTLDEESPLLGEIPELDSMGVVVLLTALEARFGVRLSDDEIDSEWFRTLGDLSEVIESRLA